MILTYLLLGTVHAQEPTPVESPAVNEQVTPPTLVSLPEVAWPGGEQDRVIVVLTIEIGADGRVTSAVPQVQGDLAFDAAAQEALRGAVFVPASDSTGPIPVLVDFTYEFVRPPPPPPPSGRLEGQALQKGTTTPMVGARIRVETFTGTLEATTDAEGRWALDAVPAGPVTLRVVALDHDDATAEVALVANEATSVQTYSRSRAYSESEALGRYEVEQAPVVTRRTISMEETRRVPGSFGDPVRVVQSLPGVAVTPQGPGNQGLVLRGSNSENSKIYIDGVEVPLVYHLGNFRSVINPNVIEQVEYLPGTFGVKYGRGTGGVIDIKSGGDYPDKWRGAWQTDFLDTSVFAQGKLFPKTSNPIGVTAAVRRSYLDLWLPAIIPDDSPTINPRWMDWQIKVDDLDGTGGTWMVFAYGTEDRLFVTSDDDSSGQLENIYGTNRVVARYASNPTLALRGSVQGYIGTSNVSLGLGDVGSFEQTSWDFGVRASLEVDLAPALTAVAGVDSTAAVETVDVEFDQLPIPTSDPFAEPELVQVEETTLVWSPDPYAELRLRPLADHERWLISAGLRMSTWGVDDEAFIYTFDPRLLTRFKVSDHLSLKAGTGIYHQTLSRQTINPYEVVEQPFEEAWSSEIGAETRFATSWTADATAFYKTVDRIAVDNPDFSDPDTDPLYIDTGTGRMYGAEFMLRKSDDGPLFGWLSYTLSKSERRDADDLDWYAYDFDQPHNLVALASYRLPYDFEVSARTQYTTGSPFTESTEGYYDLDVAEYEATTDTVNGARQPAYATVDVRVSKLWTFKKLQLLTYLDILGIVQGENPQGVNYQYDYDDYTFLAGLPTIPSLGFELKGAF